MRRDKKLAEEILRTLAIDEQWSMDLRMLVGKLKDKATELAIHYHAALLEDIGLVTISEGISTSSSGGGGVTQYVRVTSAGQDCFENLDKPNATLTWTKLGS
jgi:hypothetical protein